jgi:molybdopterin-binding protein
MGGGLMQLVAYGAQDVYLSGNPQITFFKVVYRRHTNFAVEPIVQTWNGSVDFGRQVTCTINRNGDLITNMYVSVTLGQNATAPTTAWGYVKRLGHALIQSCKIEIGGSQIDQHYGDWLNIWYELTHKTGQTRGYKQMIGDVPALTNVSTNYLPQYQMYIPLQFWFNRNNGLALPLIALQYHDVRITVIFRQFNECINFDSSSNSSPPGIMGIMNDSYLVIDYIYLDAEERKRFAQASHEYLIEQLQFTGSETITGNNNNFRLNFNHPCKYLIWSALLSKYQTASNWIAYAFDGNWANALDRFAKILWLVTRSGLVFNFKAGAASSCTITDSAGTFVIGDLVSGNVVTSSLTYNNMNLMNLVNKIEVKAIVQASNTSNSAPIDILGSNHQTQTSASGLLNAVLNNLIVVNNNLTTQDISLDADWLSSALASLNNANVNSLLNAAKFTVIDYTNYGNYIDGSDNPITTSKLQLNGHDRFQARDGVYFNYVQPYQHFSNTPADGVNVYSFALKPEDHQPSGSCNFSRIDNATLNLNYGYNNQDSSGWKNPNDSSSLINVYTMNYNVLRVMSGMAGTAYSN